jgi:hypothetical protein
VSDNPFVEATLSILREACEGGEAGQGTAFLENTKADGSGNAGVFATLESLSAIEASAATALGTSIAAHAAHLAFHLEVSLRWATGDRGPFDWKGSFEPRAVDQAEWTRRCKRVRDAYNSFVAHARSPRTWNIDDAENLAAAVAHAVYHLGAIRQVQKLAAGVNKA